MSHNNQNETASQCGTLMVYWDITLRPAWQKKYQSMSKIIEKNKFQIILIAKKLPLKVN